MSKPIWNLYRKISFKKAKYVEINDNLMNPCRGWYQIHTFKLGDDISMVDREYTLNNSDSIAFILIDISAYKDKDIDEEGEKKLRTIFEFFCSYRLDLIVRVVYDTEGKCLISEPATEDRIIAHINQIFAILKDYQSGIFVYQGLLIGNWGEMHSSKFLSPARLRTLSENIFEKYSDVAYLAVRRPAYVRIMFPEGEDVRQKKVGLFDDAILASPTHLGTFGEKSLKDVRREMAWLPEEELRYVSELCDRVPYGGEALWNDEEDSLTPIRKSLAEIDKYFSRLHVTYLNRVHDIHFIENIKELKWEKKGLFKGMDGYEYLSRHLGYRFVLKNVKCQLLAHEENTLRWDITIENRGFARAFFKSGCYMEGRDEYGEIKTLDISDWIDLNLIPSKSSHTFVCMTPVMTGPISIRFTKQSTDEAVYFANKKFSEDSISSKLLLGELNVK